jgi:hypothetical protein
MPHLSIRSNERISRIHRAADPIKPIWHSISQVKLSPTRGSYDSSSSIDLPKSSSDQRIRRAESAHAYQYPERGSYCTIYKQSEAQQGRRARGKPSWSWRISVVQANWARRYCQHLTLAGFKSFRTWVHSFVVIGELLEVPSKLLVHMKSI